MPDIMAPRLSFSPNLAKAARTSGYHFVVTGANGWMGKATLEMLHQALGSEFASRVTALGSRQAENQLTDGIKIPVHPLLEWKLPLSQPTIIFHYAFLTKDKVGGISTEEYIQRNESISYTVRNWISSDTVKGVIMPSSGAVYDFLQNKSRDPAAVLYGQLKYNDEQAFSKVCKAHGAGLIIPRLFNLSGPYINKFESYALASFIFQILSGKPVTIHARRPVIRSYYFIGDLLELCLQLLFRQTSPVTECFDVAGDETVELGALALRVAAVLKEREPVITERLPMQADIAEDRYVGDRKRIQELEKNVGIMPITLDDQIRATSQYIESVIE